MDIQDEFASPGRIFIDVWNCRAVVSRYMQVPGGSIGFVPATNAEELEDDALTAISAQGGAFNLSGHYVCPELLAARAVFAAE